MTERNVNDRSVPDSSSYQIRLFDFQAIRDGARPCADPECYSLAPPLANPLYGHVRQSDYCPVHDEGRDNQ